jgi:hypothetical protein
VTAPDAGARGAGADESTLLTQAIQSNASRLGLTWDLRMATVQEGSNPAAVLAVLDGDTAIVAMVSMIGALPKNQRVYVDVLPPSGLFICGYVGSTTPAANVEVLNNTGGADTCSNVAFETIDNIGGPLAFTKVGAAETSLLVVIHISMFVTAAVTIPAVGARITGVADTQMFAMGFNVANSHTAMSGVSKIVVPTAGAKSITPIWRNSSGPGVLTRNVDDYISMSVSEVMA